jgi:tetratricopeptide (TPR) repeat protein
VTAGVRRRTSTVLGAAGAAVLLTGALLAAELALPQQLTGQEGPDRQELAQQESPGAQGPEEQTVRDAGQQQEEGLQQAAVAPAGDGRPVWLRMEEVKEHFDERTYGSALRILRDILERQPRNANAHLWVGHVFFAEGEFAAAEEKYRDALELEDRFYPYGLRYEALYSLAEIARLRGEEETFHETMTRIIAEGSEQELSENRRRAMMETFMEQGPDKLLELYRLQDKRVRRAYAHRGLYAFEQQEYEEARNQLVFSACISLSLAIEAVREEVFDYSFIQEELPVAGGQFTVKNTRRFLRKAEERPYLRDYFSAISFYRDLFVLAASLQGMGRSSEAEALWLLVAEHREAGKWSALARKQLGEPDLQAVPPLFPE